MRYLLVLSLIFVLSPTVFAKEKKLGAGVMIGSYTALSGEYILNKKNSFDVGLAFDVGNDKKFFLQADYLFHRPETLKVLGQLMNWYYGVGARVLTFDKKKSDDDYRIGARASAGLSYNFESVNIKLFSEAGFIFNILPATSADLDILLGVRYYF